MSICKKCRKPLHPLSRYAAIGIGPCCLRGENIEVPAFLKEMNIDVSDKDWEYANDLNAANDIEIENKKAISRFITVTPNISEMLSKVSNSKVFIPKLELIRHFDVKFDKSMTSKTRGELLLDVAVSEGEDTALAISKERSGRANEMIRKFGLKKYKEDASKAEVN
jgi:hypothetical protein